MSTPLHILIIDDSAKDALLLERRLKKEWSGLTVARVETEAALHDALEQQSWNCILCDMIMPGFGAPMALESMREIGSDVPFIIVSGVVDTEDVISMLKAGAHDFIRKDDPSRLIPAVQRALESFENEKNRQQVERALRKSEALLNKSQEIAQIGSWELDLNTKNLTWSDEVYRLFGLQPQELNVTYEILLDFVHPDDREVVDSSYSDSIRDGHDTYEVEHRIIRRDNGEVRTVYEKCEHIRDASGEIVRSVGMVQDITERKQAEEKASLFEQRLRLHREQSPLAIIEWNTDFQVIDWNAAAAKMFGYSLDEVVNRDFIDIMLPESAMVDVRQIWTDLMAQSGGTKSINENITKDGRTILCEWHNTALRDGSGTVIGAASLLLDVTAQNRAQQALQAKEQEQRDVLNTMVDAVITIDEAGKVTSFNKAAESLFGYTFDEVSGRNVSLLMPEPDSSKHDAYLQHYLQTGDATVIGTVREVEGKSKNDHTFPLRLSVAELPADESGKRRFIGTCQDLTEIRQQEEHLRRSQKMDALGKLTGGIAHDFNNLLGIVTGYAQLLEEMLEDQPELADYAQEIHHAGDRGAKLTRKLLSFSRQDAPEATKIDINKLVKVQQDMLQKILTVRVKLILDLADDAWPIYLDQSELEDTIVNIGINAMHAMLDIESGARLTICTRNQTLGTLEALALGLKAGDYVQLSLADTGTGMDAATKERVFDPFFTTKGDKGTGLGLSQVFGFVKRASGAISVYSEPGHGSNFVLYFPRYLGDHADGGTDSGEHRIDLRGNEIILIVEDEAGLRRLAANLLSKQGYQTLSAENAEQALEILEREHIDLMLTDIIMPGMDGYKLAALVQEKYPAVRIQLASGFSDTWRLDVTDQSLHRNLLHKPYDSQSLFKSIRDLLDK